MDRRHGDGNYTLGPVHDSLQGRPSVESVTSARLQKNRSVKRARSDANRLTAKAALAESYENNERKPSLKDAVKKIFSRRSKPTDDNGRIASRYAERGSLQTTPLKYYSVQPSQPSPAPIRTSPDVSDRAGSIPLQGDATDFARLRSPNALEFPKSRHLKPLALPTPFDDPRGTLRRRKTLPSILVAPEDAREIAAAIREVKAQPDVVAALPRTSLTNSTSRKEKRRSRSAGDLREQVSQTGPQRNRSDEIRFWRESIQTAILRSSNFTGPETAIIESQDVHTPFRNSMVDPLRESVLQASPAFDIRSSMYGTEMARDLEDRVAKLEANLQFFQRSLDRMQAGQKRRADRTTSPREHRRRDSAEHRTPSMLAEDLHSPLAPSQYQYAFEPNERPQTAPTRPVRPPRPDESVPPLPSMTMNEQSNLVRPQSPQITARSKDSYRPRRPSRPDDPPTIARPSSSHDATALRSLYQMLDDERAARQRLETQISDMRNEISDLQHQVSAQSQIQSQRSSYLFPAPSEITAGSSRLRDLLAEAEALSRRSISPQMSSLANKVSRFSASTRQESEAGHTQASSDDLIQEQEMDRNTRTPRVPLSIMLAAEAPASTGSERSGPDDYKTPTQAFPLPRTFKDGSMF